MRRRRESFEAAVAALSGMLSGAALRAAAAIVDVGEAMVAVIGDDSSSVNDVHSQKRDVWTIFTDALSGVSYKGRLFAPGGILWRAPSKGDGAHAIRGRRMNGPGGWLVIVDGGDGATDNVVPDWMPDDAGLYEPTKILHIEAKGKSLLLKANTGDSSKICSVTLNDDGSIDLTAAPGKTVNVNGTDFSLPKWENFVNDLATALGKIAPSNSGGPILTDAGVNMLSFIGSLAGHTYNSTKAKNG